MTTYNVVITLHGHTDRITGYYYHTYTRLIRFTAERLVQVTNRPA